MNRKIKSFNQQVNADLNSKPIRPEGASLRRIKNFISVSCDNSFVGMGLFSLDGNFSIVNRELCRMLGRTEKELKIVNFYDLIYTDDLNNEPEKTSCNKLGKISNLQCEVRFSVRGGVSGWFLAIITAVCPRGRNVSFFLQLIDINSKKQAELEQERSAKLLQTIINSIHDLIYVKDLDGRFLVASQALARQLGGQTPEELVGKTDYDLFPYELAHSYFTDEQKIIQTGDPLIDKEEPSVRPDGKAIWLLTTKMPYYSAEGKIIGIVGVGHDITERKQIEIEREHLLDEVQHSQKLLRSVIDTTPDWIFIKDCEHRYLMVNQGYANALHINAEDFIGKNDLELGFPEEFVKGSPVKGIRGFWSDDHLVIDRGQMQVYPNDPATVDGVEHTFHTVKSPLKNASGQVWGVLAFARDITEVKKSNERLEMLTNAIERVDIPVFINNDEGALVYVNPKACLSLGYTSSELLAMDLTDIDHHFDSGMLKSTYAELQPGQLKFLKLQSKHIDKYGHVFPVEISATIYNWQGKNFGVSLVRDLSNQHQTDEMLIQSEQDFMVLVEYSPDIIVRYNHFMKCVYVNKAWETITGYSQYSMLDKTPMQNSFLPDEVTRRMEKNLLQVIQTRQGVQWKFVLPHASTGEAVHLLVDALPEDNMNGDLAGLLVVARNITKLEEAGELLKMKQDILEEAQQLGHIGSWELDLGTNKREWSKETYRIFEIEPDQVIPSNDAFMGLVHPDDRSRVEKIYCEFGSPETSYEVEFRLLFPDGRVKYVNERGITQFDDSGKPKRYLGSVQDITGWKALENEIILALEKAEGSSRLKSSFLAIMSHEVRTPMNAILGFSTLLKDDSLTTEERNEFIGYIDMGIIRLIRLIDELIELSKLVSGDIPVKVEPYSPKEIIMQQKMELDDFCRREGKVGFNLKIEIANNLDGKIFVSDVTRIKQTIKVLTNNAVKFTYSGEVILGVRLTDPGHVTFYVSDTGIGIPPEKQEVIFDPFVQVEGSLSRKFEGLGIGLSAARKIARVLGGDLTLVSEPSKGSVFSFTIPTEYTKRG
jgi:PAS domain S-box-containing protein